jgi:hypothetical protein
MQILLILFAIIALVLLFRKDTLSNRVISTILAILWIWTGSVYHLAFFATINNAAYAFGGLFIIQGFLFFFYGATNSKLSFNFTPGPIQYTGILIVLYALLVYPLLGYYLGHRYPESPTFGLPCPTVIFTFGILLFADKKVPVILMIIPLIWSVIGFSAALSFGILEDIGLLISGLAGLLLVLVLNRNLHIARVRADR